MKSQFLNAIGVGIAMVLGGFVGMMTSSFDGGPAERVEETAFRTACGTAIGLAGWVVIRIGRFATSRQLPLADRLAIVFGAALLAIAVWYAFRP